MKHDYLPAWLQYVLLGSLALIVVLMPVHAFISTWGGTEIGPLWLWKSWKELLLAGLTLPIIGWLSIKPVRWRVLGRDRLFWFILGFIVLLVMMSLYYLHENGADAFAAGLAMDSRYLLIFGIGYVLFRFGRFSWEAWSARMKWFLVVIGVVLAVLAFIQVMFLPADFLAQFGYDKDKTIAPYILIDENPEALRAFATMRGPNDLGAYLLLPLAVSLLFARRSKRWLFATAAIIIGVFLTGSRSAWIGGIITLGIASLLIWGKALLRSRQFMIGAGASLVVIAGIGIAALSVPAVRLAVFHSSPEDSSLTEGSTDKHWQATADGIKRVVEQPLGCGAGCAGPASYYSSEAKISENYYVQIAEETGVIGLALWAAIAATIGWRLWKIKNSWLSNALLASFVALSAIGLWLHVWSDDPLSLTWWALTGAVLGYYASASGKKSVS